jgi:DNA modification methylase
MASLEHPMNPTQNDQLLVANCLDVMMKLPDESFSAVVSDVPYPNGQGLFTNQIVDGLIGLYLATKKAKNYVVFFWSPNHEPPRPPPGWWRVATHVWNKVDSRSTTPWEVIIVWSRTYKRMQSKVWTIPILDYRTLRDFGEHPCQKPVRLMLNLIRLYTKEGDIVLDPFAGTGTTAVACKYAKRHYLAIESNPEYAAFAQKRLANKEEQASESTAPPSTTTEATTTEAIASEAAPSAPKDEPPLPKPTKQKR